MRGDTCRSRKMSCEQETRGYCHQHRRSWRGGTRLLSLSLSVLQSVRLQRKSVHCSAWAAWSDTNLFRHNQPHRQLLRLRGDDRICASPTKVRSSLCYQVQFTCSALPRSNGSLRRLRGDNRECSIISTGVVVSRSWHLSTVGLRIN
jgi:hypothetical protein